MLFNYSNTRVTIELRELLKMTDENGKPFDLWDFEYPSYYEGEAKKAFERKVIDHYYFRQIGVETPARFKHNFATRMREIMPYYLQMYKSCEIMDKIEDPFGNIDITETFTETRSGSTTGTSTGSSSGTVKTDTTGTDETTGTSSETGQQAIEASEHVSKLHKVSDTPQGEIQNLEDYMSGATSDTDSKTNSSEINDTKSSTTSGKLESASNSESESASETSGTSSSTSEGNVTHTLKRQGNHGVNTYAHDMIEFRQSFINVDMMIIRELSDLFLQIY